MMNLRSLGLFVSTLILLAVSNAWAEHSFGPGETDADISDYTGQGGEGPLPPFSELDRDGDGRLDPKEAAQSDLLRRQFQAADVDQDGSIDQEEFSAFEIREGVMPGFDMEE